MSQCSSTKCHARIRWAKTEGGRNMPLDADPVNAIDATNVDGRGIFWLDTDNVAHPWRPGLDRGLLYRAHWGTCADKPKFTRNRP